MATSFANFSPDFRCGKGEATGEDDADAHKDDAEERGDKEEEDRGEMEEGRGDAGGVHRRFCII